MFLPIPFVVTSHLNLHLSTIVNPEWMFVEVENVLIWLRWVKVSELACPQRDRRPPRLVKGNPPILLITSFLSFEPHQRSICFMISSMASSGVSTDETSL